MAIKKQGLVMPGTTTRRQFTGLLCASGLLNLVGCGGGTSGANASATPAGAPQITLAPQSANFALGQSITLRAEASGSGLAYQWQRNGVALNGATGSSLQLAAAPADDGAQYSVRVSNAMGLVESPVATLTLKAASEISLLAGSLGGSTSSAHNGRPDNVVAGKDGVVYFSCGIVCGKVSAQGEVSFLGDFP